MREVLTVGTACDHRIVLAVDYSLKLTRSNINLLCDQCHSVKTMTYDHWLKNDQKIKDSMNNLTDFDEC